MPLATSRWERLALWAAFVAVHVLLTVAGTWWVSPSAFGDLDLYRFVAEGALEGNRWPVLDGPWVYPPGALVPVLLPALIGATELVPYTLVWCATLTTLNGVATAALVRRTTAGAWWWIVFLAAFGPVALGRLDGVLAPLVVIALLAAARAPRLASTLLAVGAWIKIVPGALLLPLLAAVRRPWRDVVVPVTVVSVVVAGMVLLATLTRGTEGFHLFSAVSTQGDRGLQAESVVATPWVLAALVTNDVEIVYDRELFTYEVYGPGAQAAAGVLDVLLPLGVAALGLVLLALRRRGGPAAVLAALPVAALAIAVTLIVTNKVGSPQFLTWLAPPVAAALAAPRTRRGGPGRSRMEVRLPGPQLLGWRGVAVVLLVMAGLTQLLFPHGYLDLVTGDPVLAGVLAVRNLLTVVVFVAAVGGLVRLLRAPRTSGTPALRRAPEASPTPDGASPPGAARTDPRPPAR